MASPANGSTNGHAAGAHASDINPEDAAAPLGEPSDEALDGAAFASVGDWLAARRHALGLSLQDVEAHTRVREDYLAAIEDVDPRRMPTGPYAPGFVRTYALSLDLDPNEVAARFRDEVSPRRLRAQRAPETREKRAPVRIPGRAWAALGAVAITAALVGYGLTRTQDDAFNQVPAVPEGLEEWVQADIALRATSSAPTIVGGPELALRARVPVWLEAHGASGEVLFAKALEAGEVWTAPRAAGVRVSTDNGAAVEVLLDGRPSARLGPPGLPVTDWRADQARGWEPAVVAAVEPAAPADAAATPGAEPAAGGAPLEPALADGAAMLEELEAEESLVSPELPAGPEIVEQPLPPILAGDVVAVPDPDETAAASGPTPREVDSTADAPDVE